MNKIYVNLTFINDNFIEKNLQFTKQIMSILHFIFYLNFFTFCVNLIQKFEWTIRDT